MTAAREDTALPAPRVTGTPAAREGVGAVGGRPPAPDRRCVDCMTRLNSYNPGPWCGPCDLRVREATPVVHDAGLPKKRDPAAREAIILDLLSKRSASMPELAEAVGVSDTTISSDLKRRLAGKVERYRVNGGNRYRMIPPPAA